MNILTTAEQGKADALYRLESLALKAHRRGDHTRAKDLRNRAAFLQSTSSAVLTISQAETLTRQPEAIAAD